MSTGQRIFIEIPLSSERDQILADTVVTQCEINIKFSENKILLAKALQYFQPHKLQVTYPDGPRALVQSKVSLQFSCRDQKYFAQAHIQDSGQQFFLLIEGAIYKVQRRESFRLKLPRDYPMQAEIFEINGHREKESVRVLDLSEGGCSLELPTKFHPIMGAYLGLNIKIGARPMMTQYGHVRYAKYEKSGLRLGIEFDQNQKLNAEIFSLTRNLYIELFSKWARRK